MRLINTKTLQLTEFMGDDIPPYAILSHTWEDQEITFQDLNSLSHADLCVKKPRGFAKVVTTCRLALERDNLAWAWVDTCCIDKSSSAELTEAINSMFAWYSKSKTCYVYLSDFHPNPIALSDHPPSSTNKTEDPVLTHLSQCKWFTRGWTLQELIAPQQITFFTSSWHPLGTKLSLSTHLSSITKISQEILLYTQSLSSISVAQRMSWASSRKTTRPEDTAYSLLGLFSVHMPLLYGEGGTRAFIRLQEEIIKETNDLSLFAWKIPPSVAEQDGTSRYWGILSPTPAYFATSHNVELWGDPMHNSECVWTSRGLKITPVAGGGLSFGARPTYLLNLQCHRKDKIGHLWILLEQHGCDVYVRVDAHLIREDRGILTERSRVIYIRKIVTEGDVKSLRQSHKHAVDFSKVISTMKRVNMGLYLDDKTVDREGYWDHQRSLWLMQGGRNGSCGLKFAPVVGSGNWHVWVRCDVYEAQPDPYLRFVGTDGESCEFGALQMEEREEGHEDGSEDGALEVRRAGSRKFVDWLCVKVVEQMRDGQPVYVLEIEKGPATEFWDCLDGPVVREKWHSKTIGGRWEAAGV